MKPTSPTKVKVVQIQQVCIVLKDLQKMVEGFWNILNIGPWAIYPFGSPVVPDLKYYGEPAWGRYKGAVTQSGPLELELFETIEGASVYQDWVDECGEGLHHVKFIVEDLDITRVERVMAEQGFQSIQGGHFNPPEFNGHFSYFDTLKPLKCIWETSNRRGGKPPLATNFYPENSGTESPAKVKVNGITKIGFCVKDVVRTAENYWHILGIGPWEIREWGSQVLCDRFYHGKPAWGKERIANARVGDVELELVQPVEGYSIYQDWLDERGEGLHHLTFLCEDVDGTSKSLIEQGFISLQSGHFGDSREKTGGFNCIDIPPLHCIFELLQQPKELPAEPILHVPVS